MRKIGWMFPAILLAVGCQKSPGAFDERPDEQPAQEAGRDEGRQDEGQQDEGGLDQAGRDGQPQGYPDAGSPYGGDQPQPGTGTSEPGTDASQGGQLGQTGNYSQEGVPQAIQGLQQNVQDLKGAEQLEHTDLVKSIRDLGNAFSALPAGTTPAVQDAVSRINSYADRIEAAGATSDMYGRWAKRALNEAVGALDAYQKDQQLTALENRIDPLKTQVDAIVDDETFLQNKDAYADAYQQIADTLAMAAYPADRGTR